MRSIIWITVGLAGLVALPCLAGITVDLASDVDFDAFSTFAWFEAESLAEPRSEPSADDAGALIRDAIAQELARRGLREVTENPDLLVRSNFVVRGEIRDDVDILNQEGRWSQTSEVGGEMGEIQREIDMGTLTIDLLDGYSKLQLWRATATAVVRPQANKRSKKRIDKVVGKMFENYPVE